LSKQSDHEEVKKIHTEILSEDNKKILTKDLAATYKVKQAFLTDEELIQVCHNNRVNEHLEVKRTEDLIQRRHNISNLRDQITTRHTRCVMRVNYYEFHNKVINVKESGMRTEI